MQLDGAGIVQETVRRRSLRAPALVKLDSKPVSGSLRSFPTRPVGQLWPESFVIRVRNFILLNTTFDPSNLI